MDVNEIFWIYFAAVNIISFFIIAYDKHKARKAGWRVPEIRIFLIGLIMGAPGIYAGMQIFRHKTQHKKFVIGIPVLIILNVICIYLLYSL